MRPGIEVMRVSAKTGDGRNDWLSYVTGQCVRHERPAVVAETA